MLIREIASELRRELALRKQVFPRLIEQGRLTTVESEERMERLGAALWFFSRIAVSRKEWSTEHLMDLIDRLILTETSVQVPQSRIIKGCA